VPYPLLNWLQLRVARVTVTRLPRHCGFPGTAFLPRLPRLLLPVRCYPDVAFTLPPLRYIHAPLCELPALFHLPLVCSYGSTVTGPCRYVVYTPLLRCYTVAGYVCIVAVGFPVVPPPFTAQVYAVILPGLPLRLVARLPVCYV